MRAVLLSAVSVAGKFVGSIGSLDLRCVACGFNEMPALRAPAFGNAETPGPLPLGGEGGPPPAFSLAGAGRTFARRRVVDVQGKQPATARRRVRGSRACARPYAAHSSPVKAFGNDHAASGAFSRNSSGAPPTRSTAVAFVNAWW
jgi:hypothetical protein